MRALVRTKRQARQRLLLALNAVRDVYAAIQAKRITLRNKPANDVFQAESHLKAALADMNSKNAHS